MLQIGLHGCQLFRIAWHAKPKFGPLTRGVVRLSTPGGQESNISSIFPHSPRFSLIFPQFFSIFFLNLGFRVGGPPTWEGPGYATAPNFLALTFREKKGHELGLKPHSGTFLYFYLHTFVMWEVLYAWRERKKEYLGRRLKLNARQLTALGFYGLTCGVESTPCLLWCRRFYMFG